MMLYRISGRVTVRYRFHAGKPLEQFFASDNIISGYRVGTVIVKLQVTMPELQFV